jgi:hypothetical protein
MFFCLIGHNGHVGDSPKVARTGSSRFVEDVSPNNFFLESSAIGLARLMADSVTSQCSYLSARWNQVPLKR